MTFKPLATIEGSELFALPDDTEQLAELSAFAGKHFGYTGQTPRNAPERVNLWRAINTEFAVLTALGALAEPENPGTVEITRISNAARSKARAQCEALLERGYQP
ncbi:hypothetical protein [Pelagibacterium lentulum]|uniref:Uncharacterized protein n=1 Tax=Pelagibacterium lentulum TaxID=2029865 RepID=A0A916VWN4_9HYPH|nr:hypothetical protein [Pelagibacterium lentulum]GGA47295.1 hypothetical protein GCM10011499_16360 [Pelagibacterium lentulum]